MHNNTPLVDLWKNGRRHRAATLRPSLATQVPRSWTRPYILNPNTRPTVQHYLWCFSEKKWRYGCELTSDVTRNSAALDKISKSNPSSPFPTHSSIPLHLYPLPPSPFESPYNGCRGLRERHSYPAGPGGARPQTHFVQSQPKICNVSFFAWNSGELAVGAPALCPPCGPAHPIVTPLELTNEVTVWYPVYTYAVSLPAVK